MKRPLAIHRRRSSREAGFALIVVLLVLLALLVLATPYLSSARDADRASAQLADRAAARVGLESASRRARSRLSASYPSLDLDRTPYHDDLDEIRVRNDFPAGFWDANDPRGPMWDVELQDDAGRIDLNSAPPQVFANLLDLTTRFTQVVAADAKELPLAGRAGLADTGFLWCDGELVRYSKIEGSTVTEFVRGVLGPSASTDWLGGPRPAASHGVGSPVIDQRAFAPVEWRTRGGDGDLRAFASFEELPGCGVFVREHAAAGGDAPRPFPDELVAPLVRTGTVYADPRGGDRWQKPVRLASPVQGKKDGRFRVDDLRWFNPGATVRLRDAASIELAIVQQVDSRTGMVILDRVLDDDHEAFTTVVEVLARRPVNVNTAPRDVLLAVFANLQIAGRNSRVTTDEAEQLADLVLESRPFTGFEDFLRRVVLPAAGIEKLPADAPVRPTVLGDGAGFLDPWDALAVYANAQNANDGYLGYATMPFSFTTRDTYAYELRSTVLAESGVERAALVRDEVALVVPQQELTRLWARQEDFDEELRLTRAAPWWTTGPNSTSRYDGGTVPPSRLWAHMGTAEGNVYVPGITDPAMFADRESPPRPEHVFASREDQGWVQLMTLREDDTQFAARQGRVLHFDHETRDPEGRWLPDQVVARSTDDTLLQFTTPDLPLVRPFSCSMWIKPRTVNDATYLDVAGTSGSVDRVSLLVERGDLVLRVVDGFGDHRDTTFVEAGELRFALSGADTPGLPVDTWSHVEIDVRGNRPSQLHMLVNGLAHGVRRLGLTRLTSSLATDTAVLSVESTEGFPETCVVRVGNELIEVRNTGPTTLDATRQTTGRLAGFGGRVARERMQTLSDIQPMVPISLATIGTVHGAGTSVELYGYAQPTRTEVTTGKAEMPGELGPFRVARAKLTVGAGTLGEPITIGFTGFTIGLGMKGAASSTVTGLELEPADSPLGTTTPADPSQFMPAFHRDGGYAALIQIAPTQNDQPLLDNDGVAVGGIEIIRYSGWTGTTLQILQRGIDATTLQRLANMPAQLSAILSGRRSFVTTWNDILGVDPPIFQRVDSQLYVVPISLAVPGIGQVQGFLEPPAGESRFAQITRVDDAEYTEWVRYDEIDLATQHLVRDDPNALLALYRCLVHSTPPDLPAGVGAPGGGGGPGGGGSGPSSAPTVGGSAYVPRAAVLSVPWTIASAPLAQSTTGTSVWDPRIGTNENDPATWPISRTAETNFQFRGVLGTYSHRHPNATPILPVFATSTTGVDGGRPGRMDAVFVTTSEPTHLGWPLRVHRAYVPSATYEVIGWRQQSGQTNASYVSPTDTSGTQIGGTTEPFLLNNTWYALQDRCPEIILPGTSVSSATFPTLDSRVFARLSCFPSGERPRLVSRATIGGAAGGTASTIPAALVDEIVFGDDRFGRQMPNVDPEHVTGASLVVQIDFDENATSFRVEPKVLRVALGNVGSTRDMVGDLPPDAGLLRVGDEILAYQSYDASLGEFQVATNGRGLLGTRPQPHQVAETVTFLEHRVVSVLGGAVSAGDGVLPVANSDEFALQDTVLVGEELVTYTRKRQSALEMPRASSVAGAMDERGDGLFRGRYGSTPAAHAAGEPVIPFPTRYPDRWAERADAPELAYFGFSVDQPAAYWNAFWFSKVDTDAARIGVVVRAKLDVPWDADPETDKRLRVVWQGETQSGRVPIDVQSDRITWRAFVDYQPGAFDARTGLAHGWKATPRLKMFGAFYHAPSIVLRSVER